jgi:hypothetical protein
MWLSLYARSEPSKPSHTSNPNTCPPFPPFNPLTSVQYPIDGPRGKTSGPPDGRRRIPRPQGSGTRASSIVPLPSPPRTSPEPVAPGLEHEQLTGMLAGTTTVLGNPSDPQGAEPVRSPQQLLWQNPYGQGKISWVNHPHFRSWMSSFVNEKAQKGWVGEKFLGKGGFGIWGSSLTTLFPKMGGQ